MSRKILTLILIVVLLATAIVGCKNEAKQMINPTTEQPAQSNNNAQTIRKDITKPPKDLEDITKPPKDLEDITKPPKDLEDITKVPISRDDITKLPISRDDITKVPVSRDAITKVPLY